MKTSFPLRSAGALCLLVWGAVAHAAPTNVAVRDPSTIIKRDGVYYLFGTGTGTPEFSSRDHLTWQPLGPALSKAPAWLAGAVPQNLRQRAWAPDVAFFGGEYRLYSAYSSLGSKRSAIGLSTNRTLDAGNWADQGIVVSSGEGTSFNTIDPGVFQDAKGSWWMTFGSYFSGIYIAPLDTQSGKFVAGSAPILIASRPDSPGNAIEASTAYYHDGYYYLFTNWGNCLQGPRSTYTIRVCRSRNPSGPYEDRTGKEAVRGGGSLFLTSVIDDGTGRPFDEQVGPGHAAILRDGEGYLLSTHYEWSRFLKGQTTVNVQGLSWDTDGWPRPVLDSGPFQIVSHLGTFPVLSENGKGVETNFYEGSGAQKWVLKHLGDGFYSLSCSANGLALGTVGGAFTAGTKVELAPFRNVDSQKWLARQNEDGSYSLLLKAGGGRLALDVPNASLNDGTPLQVWDDNFSNPQKWSFRAR